MSYLLDTNVVSELRKGVRANAGVVAWLKSVADEETFLSVIVIGEIRRGVESLRRRDPEGAGILDGWLSSITDGYRDRVLSIDQEIADEWGRMNVPDPLPVADGLQAATAKVRGLVLVTRNTADIERTGVAHVDPFS